MSDVRDFGVEGKGVMYPDDYLEQLAADIINSVEYTNKASSVQSDSTGSSSNVVSGVEDTWDGKCLFTWPNRSFVSGTRVLTPNDMSRCYLDQVEPGRWYMLKDKWGYPLGCEYEDALSVPLADAPCPGMCFNNSINTFHEKSLNQLVGDTVIDALSSCLKWMTEYRIKPGLSWGKAASEVRRRWARLDCDLLVKGKV